MRAMARALTHRLTWIMAALCAASVISAYAWRRLRVENIAEPRGNFSSEVVSLPLNVAPGKRYLVDRQGRPFLIHGDAAWSMIAQVTLEQAEVYFADRHRRGYNLVLVNLLEHKFADHAPSNAYGEAPFSTPGEFSTPNDAYFSRAERFVALAAKYGIIMLLCPAYLGGDGGDEGWYVEMLRDGPEKLHKYGEYVGTRFRRFENLVWATGGDYTPPLAHLDLVEALQAGIKQASPNQLQTAHWSPEISADDVRPSGYLDFNTTYTYEPVYIKSLADFNHGKGRPQLLVESRYELERNSTQRSLRAQAYYALLTGAMGQIFGNRWVWTFTQPTLWNRLAKRNWVAASDSPGNRSMGHLRALFSTLAWYSLVPDETYEILVSGQGLKGTLDYPVLASSSDGRLAVVYVPTPRGVDIDLGKLASPLSARWYDPTNGKFTDDPAARISSRDVKTFRPPGKNSASDTDWILLLDATSSNP